MRTPAREEPRPAQQSRTALGRAPRACVERSDRATRAGARFDDRIVDMANTSTTPLRLRLPCLSLSSETIIRLSWSTERPRSALQGASGPGGRPVRQYGREY